MKHIEIRDMGKVEYAYLYRVWDLKAAWELNQKRHTLLEIAIPGETKSKVLEQSDRIGRMINTLILKEIPSHREYDQFYQTILSSNWKLLQSILRDKGALGFSRKECWNTYDLSKKIRKVLK